MVINPIYHDSNCRVCNSDQIITVMTLTPTPPGDKFIKKEEIHIKQDEYPLVLALCQNCGYLHLPYRLNPEISYSDYIYQTSVTLGLKEHYDTYADSLLSYVTYSPDSLVIDIGSNDGTMLEAFKRRGVRVLGIEPAHTISVIANKKGIETINDYFSEKIVKEISLSHGKASIITANYMFANIDDPLTFTQNVSKLLDYDGIFVVQTGYHPEQMKLNMFDYIYHEHYSYFSLQVLSRIFNMSGLVILDAIITPEKGGSIRVIGKKSKEGITPPSKVMGILNEEHLLGIHKKEVYLNFGKTIDSLKNDFLSIVDQIKHQGKRIVGYGASHSTTTLLYHFELARHIEYLVDDNPLKHGLFSPGYHLPVYASDRLYSDKPDAAIILAWQYQNSIIRRNLQYIRNGGIFLIPLPKIDLIANESNK